MPVYLFSGTGLSPWRLSYFAILLAYLLGRFRNTRHKKGARSIRSRIALVLSATIIITFFVSLYQDLLSSPRELPAVGFAGCYTVGPDGVLVQDADAEYIGEQLFLMAQKTASSHSSFSVGLLNVYQVHIPCFIPPLLGQQHLDSLIQRRAKLWQCISLIYCYRKPNSQQLEFRTVFFSGAFQKDNLPFDDRLEDDLSSISADTAFDTASFLNFASSYFVAVMGQGVVDYLISEKQYRQAHMSLDDSETIFRRQFSNLSRMGSPSTVTRINWLASYWYANLERLRASLLTEQGDYPAAARHSLLALEYNEYFPCKNYEDFTLIWMRVYASDLKDIINEINTNQSSVSRSGDDSLEITAHWAYEPTEEQIKHLVIEHRDNSEVCSVIEDRFRELLKTRKDDPLIWLCWGDVVKFLPKGTTRENDV
jgi:hypothetical protein